MEEKVLRGKKILITGGTGSFGRFLLKYLLNEDCSEIVIFSRDEEKQVKLREEIKDSRVRFVIGDVRDFERIFEASQGMDVIFHAAALKQVPNCEFNVMEAVKTNILGAENVRRAAMLNRVEAVISISTDKAVKPVNVMGMTKALQERLMIQSNSGSTRFIVVRYGNVIGSRGSVIPLFKEKVLNNEPLPITDFRMTRFLLTLNEAINLIMTAYIEGRGGEVFVKKLPAAKVVDIAKVMAKALTNKSNYPMREIGIRPGEKVHEVLVSEEEIVRTVEYDQFYVILPYGKINESSLNNNLEEYTSRNTRILNENEIYELLKAEGWL